MNGYSTPGNLTGRKPGEGRQLYSLLSPNLLLELPIEQKEFQEPEDRETLCVVHTGQLFRTEPGEKRKEKMEEGEVGGIR